MRIFSRIVGTFYVATGAASSLLLLFLYADDGFHASVVVRLADRALLLRLFIAGLVLVLAGVVWVVNWFDAAYRNKAITFDNPGGKVNVSLRAIEEFVTSRILTQIAGAKGLRVRTFLSSRGLETAIRIQMMAGINVPETCAHIQEITKNYLQDVVGVERIAAIDIYVSNILARENGQPAAAGGETRETPAAPAP
jgi:uncharacterized alkaline shock family protein YloU